MNKVKFVQLMAKGSVWSVKNEITLYELNSNMNAFSRTYFVPSIKLPPGTQFTVIDKPITDIENAYLTSKVGLAGTSRLWNVAVSDSKKTIGYLKQNEIYENIDVVSVSESVFYVMRNKVTGLYYTGTSDKPDEIHTNGTIGWVAAKATKMWCKTPRSGKVLKDMARVKQRILYEVGYYNNMGDAAPPMLTNPEPRPESFLSEIEVVGFSSATNQEVTKFDPVEYYASVKRLSSLTLTYGSSVRNLFKKIENKNLFNDYQYVILFRPSDPVNYKYDTKGNQIHDGANVISLNENDCNRIKSAAQPLTKKKVAMLEISAGTAAVAVKDKSTALQLKLSMSSTNDLDVIAISTSNLAEDVDFAK